MADNVVFEKLDQPPIELVDMMPGGTGTWFIGLWTCVNNLMAAFGTTSRGIVQTTDATADVTLCELELREKRTYMLFAEVAVAKSDLSLQGAYQAFAVAYRASGGNATMKAGSLTVIAHSSEPHADCDVSIEGTAVASSRVRVAVTGQAGVTYNWRGILRAIPNLE